LSENADWEKIFKEIDLDGDGKIDFDEFLQLQWTIEKY
jgi:hypothetical protein